MMIEPFPLIEISGAPYERGVQYGAEGGRSHPQGDFALLRAVEGSVARQTPASPALVAIICPSSRRSSRPISRRCAASPRARTCLRRHRAAERAHRVLKLAARPVPGALKTPDEPDGCTGVVVLPEATPAGRLIHAQNWDWKANAPTPRWC